MRFRLCGPGSFLTGPVDLLHRRWHAYQLLVDDARSGLPSRAKPAHASMHGELIVEDKASSTTLARQMACATRARKRYEQEGCNTAPSHSHGTFARQRYAQQHKQNAATRLTTGKAWGCSVRSIGGALADLQLYNPDRDHRHHGASRAYFPCSRDIQQVDPARYPHACGMCHV